MTLDGLSAVVHDERDRSTEPQGSDYGPATHVRVYDCIRGNPGIHLRKIGRELGLAMGDLQYHIHGLEREGRISSFRRGLYRFFYPSNIFGERQRQLLSALTQETPRELLLNLIEKPDSSQDALARVTRLSSPTVSWHMKRLVEQGIVEREANGRFVSYRVADDSSEITRFIMTYHPAVWEKWSDRLADIVLSIGLAEGER